MMNHDLQESVYRYTPTGNGFRVVSKAGEKKLRKTVCPLFPDNRRENVYDPEQMEKMDHYPFRPVVYALLAPGFLMDMHGVSGMAGYGRFALLDGQGGSRWLDECETVETEYRDGELKYTVTDPAFLFSPLVIRFTAAAGAAGMVGCIEPGSNENLSVCLLYGGMLGWNPHSPLLPPYRKDFCWGNSLTVEGNKARISLDEEAGNSMCPALERPEYDTKGDSMNCAWHILPSWQRKIDLRVGDGAVRIAKPEDMIDFRPESLSDGANAWGALACGTFSQSKGTL